MGKEFLEQAADIIADGGDFNEARKLIIGYIKDDPTNAEAWGLMSQVTEGDARRDCLDKAVKFAQDATTRDWAERQLFEMDNPAIEEETFFTQPAAPAEDPTTFVDGDVPDILDVLGYPPEEGEPLQTETDEDFPAVDLEANLLESEAAFEEMLGEPLEVETPDLDAAVEQTTQAGLEWLSEEPDDLIDETVHQLEAQPEPAESEIPDFLAERDFREKVMSDDDGDDIFAELGITSDPDEVDESDLFSSLGIDIESAATDEDDLLGEFVASEDVDLDEVNDLFRQADEIIADNPTPPSGLDETGSFTFEPEPEPDPTVKPALSDLAEEVGITSEAPAEPIDVDTMLKDAVWLGKENQKAEAGKLVSQVLEVQPDNPDAWAIMSQIVDDPELEAQCLRNVIDLSDQPRVREWAARRLEKNAASKGKGGKTRGKRKRLGCVWRILLTLLFVVAILAGIIYFVPDYQEWIPFEIPFQLPFMPEVTAEPQAAEEPTPMPEEPTEMPAPTETPEPTAIPEPTATPVPEFGAGVAMLIEEGGDALAVSPDGLSALAGGAGGLLLTADGGLVRLGTDPVSAVAYSADGALVASGSPSGQIITYTIEDLEEGMRLAADDEIVSLAFEPDGSRLLAARISGQISVFDHTTGEELYTISPDTGSINEVAWAPNGDYFAAAVGEGALGGEVILFDQTTGGQLKALLVGAEVTTLAFNANGTLLAYGTQAGELGLWEVLKEGDTPATVTLTDAEEIGDDLLAAFPHGWDFIVKDLSFAADGMLAVGRTDGKAVLWDTGAYQAVKTIDTQSGTVNGLGWADTTDNIYTLSDATFLYWTLTEVEDDVAASVDLPVAVIGNTLPIIELNAMQAANDPVISVDYMAGGGQVAVIDTEGTVYFYDVDEAGSANLASLLNSPLEGESLTTVSGSGDVAASAQGTTVAIFDAYETTASLAAAAAPGVMALSTDGKYLAGAGENVITVWDAATGDEVVSTEWESFGAFTSIAWLPDSYIFVAGSETGITALFEIGKDDPDILEAIPLGADYQVDAVAFVDPLTILIAISDEGGSAYFAYYGVVGSEYTNLIKIGDAPVAALAVAPDSTLMATGTADGEITIWEALTAAGIGQVTAENEGVLESLAFSPDGAHVAAGFSGSDLVIWSLTE